MENKEQQLLPTFEPSEADMVASALAQPLEEKIRRSIGLLQMYERGALRLSDDGYYLAFSGGKDSCVIKQLAIEAGVKFKAFYNLTTIDPPELVRFIKETHQDVLWNKNPLGNLPNASVTYKAQCLPQRRFRWCCEMFKEQGGSDKYKIIGVRVSESARRKAIWKEFRFDNNGSGSAYICPIVYWTDEDVWSFIKSRNLSYCELYDQGFKRLGCIGCPLASQRDRDKSFERWPKYEQMWKKAAFRLYEWCEKNPITRTGSKRSILENFQNAQALWEFWRTGQGNDDADCVYEEMMMNV